MKTIAPAFLEIAAVPFYAMVDFVLDTPGALLVLAVALGLLVFSC